jgi:membrane dipeptidase
MHVPHTRLVSVSLLVPVFALASFIPLRGAPDQADVPDRVRELHASALVVDGHIDTPQRMLFDKAFDFSVRHQDGHVDLPRMREGGLDAGFMSIWVPSTLTGPPAVKRALALIGAVHETVRRHPSDLVLATTVADVRQAAAEGKAALLMGMEGGHMIDDDLGVLRSYAALGVRYLTLSHFLNNTWADSSTDTPAHGGLTPFGRDVVCELNRLGMMVDVSHVADTTFAQALATTRAPVIASHSSCRAISDHPRNMSDDMLRALARNGGVVMINYELTFLSQEYRDATLAAGEDVTTMLERLNRECGDDEACKILAENRSNYARMAAGTLPRVTWEKVVEHIDHAVKVAGIDHVGLGSDFDGATMPVGLEDASKLPAITGALLARGYAAQDVRKILGENVLRVMGEVERVAGSIARTGAGGD